MNKQIVIKIDETTKNPELAATAEGMVSADYKDIQCFLSLAVYCCV